MIAVAIPAQDAPPTAKPETAAAAQRRPVVGMVQTTDGSPAAGADVTLVSTSVAGDAERPTDIVAVTTDARGRFVARVLPGEGYSAWATLPIADRSYLASPVRENVAAGGMCPLVIERTCVQRQHSIGGADAWPGGAAFRLAFAPDALNIALFPADADGFAPRLPILGTAVLDGDGAVVAWRPGADAGWDAFRLAPPTKITLGVNSGAAPIVGAEVSWVTEIGRPATERSLFERLPAVFARRLGRSDATGTAIVEIPAQYPNGFTSMAVRAAGMADHRVDPNTFLTTQRAVVAMRPACRLRVADAPDRDFLLSAIWLPAAGSRSCRLHTDARGECVLPLAAGPLESLLSPLDHGDGRPLQTGEVRERGLLRTPWGEVAPTEVGLRMMRRVTLQVLDVDSGPAAGVPVVVVPQRNGDPRFHSQPIFTDAAGRLVLHLGPDPWHVVACRDDAVATEQVEAGARAANLVMRLKAPDVCRLRLVDPMGRPVAGERLKVFGGDFRDVGWRIANAMLATCASDAEGRIDVPFHATFDVMIGAGVKQTLTHSNGPDHVVTVTFALPKGQ